MYLKKTSNDKYVHEHIGNIDNFILIKKSLGLKRIISFFFVLVNPDKPCYGEVV